MGNNTASFIGRVATIPTKESTCTFSMSGILLMTHLLNLSKLACTFERYRAMHSSLASYFPWICPMTSWESLHIFNLAIDKVRARLNTTRIISYSASLLEVGNPSRIVCFSYSLVDDCKRRPIPDPETLDAPSKWSIHHPFLRESVSWDGFWGTLAIKLDMTYPFTASLGWYSISYSLSSMAHLSILLDRFGLWKMLLSGCFMSMITWWAWK